MPRRALNEPPTKPDVIEISDSNDEVNELTEAPAARSPPRNPFKVGAWFPTLEKAKSAAYNYAIEAGESFNVQHSHPNRRWVIICRDPKKCNFRVRFSPDKSRRRGFIISTASYTQHHCPPETHRRWRPAAAVKYLQSRHQDLFNNDQKLRSRTILAAEKALGNEISYKQAWRILQANKVAALNDNIKVFLPTPSLIMADIKPPFTAETARKKVKTAQDLWNTKDPGRVAQAYTPTCIWRNRTSFFTGTKAIVNFLTAKWNRERNYRLRKELFSFTDDRIAVQFWYEYQDAEDDMRWKRCYGLEDWTFDRETGKMRKRMMSGNDLVLGPDGNGEGRWFVDGVDVEDVDIGEEHW